MPSDLRRQLAWLIAIRVVLSTLLLGSATLLQINVPGSVRVDPFFSLIGLTYALTAVHAGTLRWVDRHRWLVDFQLACDALIVSAFLAVTGGVTSYFSLLYMLPIIAASTVQGRRGALMVGLLSTAMYASLVLAQYQEALMFPAQHWLHDPALPLPPVRVAEYTGAINAFSFLAVALLSGSLAERLRRAGARLERASTEIANLQAFSEHVIDSLTSGLVTTDQGGRVLTFNRAAEAITGHAARDVIGRAVAEVLQLPPQEAAAVKADLGGARSRRADFQYRRADARLIEIGLSAAHLVTPGGKTGFLFTFQDVTDIKKLQRDSVIQQRLAAVGEMAAGIAHEIRNPLASMSGSIQILRQELPLTSEQAQLMDIVLRESERLNDTIRSFLAYARPQRFAIARLDLGRVLNDAALLLRNSAEVQPGHVVEVDVPPYEVWYEADEGQIRQIVWNLATNGLRAMPGGGRLRLIAGRVPAEAGRATGEGHVVLTVQDEGIGIPADELDEIFQPFHGVFAKGSGLGLAIVHRIVADYNGHIEVESEPGAGTTVRVHLPARPVVVTST
jgi:two-component system sensor histidine kinase PilS (NtrC family)